jgi:hypothetical protein
MYQHISKPLELSAMDVGCSTDNKNSGGGRLSTCNNKNIILCPARSLLSIPSSLLLFVLTHV